MATRENKKLSTRERIMNSFKELALTEPIEKITIAQIADKAQVIRPTFYNYFEDKYDLLTQIVKDELVTPIIPLLENNLFYEGLTLLFSIAQRNKTFYIQAARLDGVVSFEGIVTNLIKEILLDGMIKNVGNKSLGSGVLTPEDLAEYYSHSMCFIILKWVKTGMTVDPTHMAGMYMTIVTNSFEDIVRMFEGDDSITEKITQ